jgi:hypothetical protein
MNHIYICVCVQCLEHLRWLWDAVWADFSFTQFSFEEWRGEVAKRLPSAPRRHQLGIKFMLCPATQKGKCREVLKHQDMTFSTFMKVLKISNHLIHLRWSTS